jgi:hypothetical protein
MQSDSIMQRNETQMDDSTIQSDDWMAIIKSIIDELAKQPSEGIAREMTEIILKDIFCVNKSNFTDDEAYELIKRIYEIIFMLAGSEQNSETAYYILCGFIQFGQSEEGSQYKPMLDHFAIEAFDGLVERFGWSVIKPCVLTLQYNFINAPYEPLFNHIINRIINQLQYDIHNCCTAYNSDLCNYLPSEKSFTWGWFSRYIACAYFPKVNGNITTITPKQMRTKLMHYRKLISKLRKNVIVKFVPATKAGAGAGGNSMVDPPLWGEQVEQTWDRDEQANEVDATSLVIEEDINASETEASETEASEAEASEAEASEAEASEAEASEADEDYEKNIMQSGIQTNEADNAQPTGWRSWLGWA